MDVFVLLIDDLLSNRSLVGPVVLMATVNVICAPNVASQLLALICNTSPAVTVRVSTAVSDVVKPGLTAPATQASPLTPMFAGS